MKNKRLGKLVVLLTVVALLVVGCGGNTNTSSDQAGSTPAPAKTQFISIATASMGGSYYPIGVGMSQIFTAKVPGIEPKVEVTGGATENPKLVGAGESDIGFTNANLAYAAYSGTALFKDKKYDKLRLMFSGVAPGTFHIAVRADSDIKTFADLKGKKVAMGPQGGGGLTIMPDILAIFNLKMEDVKTSLLSYDEGIQSLIDKQVEAAMVQAPHPAPSIKTLEGSTKFRLIELTDEQRDALVKKYPYYNKVDISAETYGLGSVVKTIGSSNVVVTNSDLDENLVYEMTKATFENLAQLHKVHPSAASISLQDAVTDLIPLHPGAAKYFKEKGVIK